jgi:hypothetical protein
MELLAGNTVQLEFDSEEAIQLFRETFAVFFCRQNKKLKGLGMGKEYENFTLTNKVTGTVLTMLYEKKLRPDYKILSVSVIPK